MYLDYQKLNKWIQGFKDKQKKGIYCKLPGYYVFTRHKAIISLDVFNVEHVNDQKPVTLGSIRLSISNKDDLSAPTFNRVLSNSHD